MNEEAPRLSNLTLKQLIDCGPDWHFEIHKGHDETIYSEAFRIDCLWGELPKSVARFQDWKEETAWVNNHS